ncbi:MAG: sodium:solute symporter family protein [Bdellovibrionales bacterium]|jgi:solute:Na+ symporter, SSS family|nr:sodium:solute symporter family protein [Bdellovibrionales bacterium]MBT3524813.1 sodium:solute symporter family protein [Bdellovibrionales bacterium]MBT7768180.1 sodium:solute symporter family protein [Bdellovibrionales bacterium]
MEHGMGLNIGQDATFVIGSIIVGYFILISVFGGYFARFSRNINDFFYSGQRFAWWLPAASMIATGIGSYSFLKYSEQGFNTGMSSSLTYMNDWFIVPFFMFGWLPIVYFSRVKSIPEYFERRFNKTARYVAVFIIMAYMLFYIGYNLFTIGIAIEGMVGWPMLWTIPIVATFLGAYVTFGGQTAVIFTDLFQGVMLYVAGGLAIFAGIYALGGFDEFWGWLPITHRLPFVHLTENVKFNTSGLFWGEALAGSIAFTFMNQGFIMRYLTIKSIHDCRKAVVFNVLVTLPVSAIVVGAVGWIAKSLVAKQAFVGGALAGYNPIVIENTFHTFLVVAWETLLQNTWLFGFVVAALTAALMSTIDTLINACAAIMIYDIYKPLIKQDETDTHYLKAARWASVIATATGLILVIWFAQQKGSLMSIHYKGIMVIIPAIVTTIFLGAFWRRFNATAAVSAMVLGSILTLLSVPYPELIKPLAAFVKGPQNGVYIYMRALFGMCITTVIGVSVTLLTTKYKATKAELKKSKGLTICTLDDAMSIYRGGGKPNHTVGEKVGDLNVVIDESIPTKTFSASASVMKRLKANPSDIVYVEDNRRWLGGLRAGHIKAHDIHQGEDDVVMLSAQTFHDLYLLEGKQVRLEKIF